MKSRITIFVAVLAAFAVALPSKGIDSGGAIDVAKLNQYATMENWYVRTISRVVPIDKA